MSVYLNETRTLHRFALAAAILALLMTAALLAWTSHVRYREFETYQQRLMHSSADGAAGEIGVFLNELRRSAHLFADKEAVRLAQLIRHPDDYGLYDSLEASVKSHFPEAFAFTLADRNGKPYVTDFEGRIGDICVKDIHQFAADRAHSGVYVHPGNDMYHFDVMVDWERNKRQSDVLLVSFSTDIIARILKHSELPGHRLMLLKRDIPGLIEVTSGGARNVINRENKLSPEEMNQIGYSTPVNGTFWDLVDMPEPGLFENTRHAIQREAWSILLAVVTVCLAMVAFLVRYHVRNKKLEHLYTHDAATGLPNRYFLLDRLQRCLHQARPGHSTCALLFIDLGGFRIASGAFLNHRNNHELMAEVGERVRRVLAAHDVFAHLAGNEFAVLKSGADAEAATRSAQAIMEALKSPFTADKSVMLPKAVVGIAISPGHGTDTEALTQNATAALYAARLNPAGVALWTQLELPPKS